MITLQVYLITKNQSIYFFIDIYGVYPKILHDACAISSVGKVNCIKNKVTLIVTIMLCFFNFYAVSYVHVVFHNVS
ncbi:hypothetical protein C2G38_2059942 [Gigaspora rosea]|uniref:Uncharacterized protein n=1 Tax=Gigaspora rosea TaxID=44941 RepID=A0A397W4E6_9GLOM|nr:hypothetical protein C2G38_2059942 [Gigaspora rosea]